MRALVHRAAGWHSGQALYSNRTARALRNVPRRRGSQRERTMFILVLLGLVAALSMLLLFWIMLSFPNEAQGGKLGGGRAITRVAFGASASHGYSSQPVWTNAVIPSEPDAWIWVGDMAYMDEARVSCDALPNHPQCNCSSDWLRQSPHLCMTGDVQHAASKMQMQLANPDYAQFLAFMCPGHRMKGLHPPPGTDPTVCPRPILGTYDDHDYGWRHGNKRLPLKDELKQLILDALGDATNSTRRSPGRGIHTKHVLNKGIEGREIDVLLLDTRYYRDALPCYTRRDFCEEVLAIGSSHSRYAWCVDFLRGGESGTGSCCEHDEKLYEAWCARVGADACRKSVPSFDSIVMQPGETGFCEVLGREQRMWLEEQLLQSTAPLKLLVSSSPVVPHAHEARRGDHGGCSGDEWECYKPAQIRFLELASSASGCVVLVTADSQQAYVQMIQAGARAVYQVKPSRLASNNKVNDSDTSESTGPSFGIVEVDWDERLVKLQVRDGGNSIRYELGFALGSCALNRFAVL